MGKTLPTRLKYLVTVITGPGTITTPFPNCQQVFWSKTREGHWEKTCVLSPASTFLALRAAAVAASNTGLGTTRVSFPHCQEVFWTKTKAGHWEQLALRAAAVAASKPASPSVHSMLHFCRTQH